MVTSEAEVKYCYSISNITGVFISKINKEIIMSFDNKDDLRIRMLDLENKLAESEEERFKLEKTCNALMKALREEEKMRYKVLNKKYEKFVQDCTVRKRRNDIILRSLCRIEDRSRALFAKTERLKLLKDRYVSYLKISDVKKCEVSSAITLPISPSQKSNNYDTPKSIRWKPSLVTDHETKNLEENLFASHKTSDVVPRVVNSDTIHSYPEIFYKKKAEELPKNKKGKNDERILFYSTFHAETPAIISTVQDELRLGKTEFNLKDSLENPISVQLNRKESVKTNNQSLPESDCYSKLEVKNLNEVSEIDARQQESIRKPREDSSFEEDCSGHENRQNSYIEKSIDTYKSEEKNPTKNQINSKDVIYSRINHSFETSPSKILTQTEEKYEKLEENAITEMKTDHQILSRGDSPKNVNYLPMGLDGIDFQNETYPESYYEQPVHQHNHTSIVADVILEEDETEPDGDEEEKDFAVGSNFGETQFSRRENHGSSTWERSPAPSTCNESNRKGADQPDKSAFESHYEIKSQKLDSGKNSEAKQSDVSASESKSDKSGSFAPEKSDRRKPANKSNLLHLLESDSESFQIEHGDVVSENEGSEFDFSFHC